jgi:hypothetical protein
MNVPVSYPSCKLLVENGFDEKCSKYYEIGKSSCVINLLTPYQNSNFDRDLYPNADILAPTISEAVMWLYNNYGIWIEVVQINSFFKFYFVNKIKDRTKPRNGDFNSPTEAYQEAIKFVLEKVILKPLLHQNV